MLVDQHLSNIRILDEAAGWSMIVRAPAELLEGEHCVTFQGSECIYDGVLDKGIQISKNWYGWQFYNGYPYHFLEI